MVLSNLVCLFVHACVSFNLQQPQTEPQEAQPAFCSTRSGQLNRAERTEGKTSPQINQARNKAEDKFRPLLPFFHLEAPKHLFLTLRTRSRSHVVSPQACPSSHRAMWLLQWLHLSALKYSPAFLMHLHLPHPFLLWHQDLQSKSLQGF